MFNRTFGPYYDGAFAINDHVNGAHNASFSYGGSCTYSPVSGPCPVTVQSWEGTPGFADSGKLSTYFVYHVGHSAQQNGAASATGTGASAQAAAGVAFERCVTPSCGFNIAINGGPTGLEITFPSGAIWEDKSLYSASCAGQTYTGQKTCQQTSGCGPSPLLVDVKGKGFIGGFTDPNKACVLYDLGDHVTRCYSWLKSDSGLAWLVLENKDGTVELLGSQTPQPNHPSKEPNGFLAAAEQDLPMNGGNLDLLLDKRDAIWNRGNPKGQKLRLWLDQHCADEPGTLCTPRPGEMHTLEDFGMTNIDLVYEASWLVDEASGVQFKYQSHVNLREHKDEFGNSHHVQGDTADKNTIVDAWLSYKK